MGKFKVVLGAMKVYPIAKADVVANGVPTTEVHNRQLLLHPPSLMEKLGMLQRHDTGTARVEHVGVLTYPLEVQTTLQHIVIRMLCSRPRRTISTMQSSTEVQPFLHR